MGRNLAKGTFGFIIPKPMQLPDALIKVGLALLPIRRDRQMDLTRPLHQCPSLPRPFIKGVSLMGMPGHKGFLSKESRNEGEKRDPWSE